MHLKIQTRTSYEKVKNKRETAESNYTKANPRPEKKKAAFGRTTNPYSKHARTLNRKRNIFEKKASNCDMNGS